MIYAVTLDLSLVMSRLKDVRLDDDYKSSQFPVIKIAAKNPDGACYAAISGLIGQLKKSQYGMDFIEEIQNDVSVKKIRLHAKF